jgi:hypothetical protein
MTAAHICALAFSVRVAWGAASLARIWKRGGVWARLRVEIVALEIFSSAAALVCAAALWSGRFRAWMLWPVGAAILLTVPLPCTFEAVNRIRWVRMARNILFVLLALGCFGLAGGWIPLARVGL